MSFTRSTPVSSSPPPSRDRTLGAWTTPIPKKRHAPTSDNDEIGASTPASKKLKSILKPPKQTRTRNPKKTPTRSQTIPNTYTACSPADKMLLDHRDAGGSWTSIRQEWTKLTGETVGVSTLPNRYTRLKLNLTEMSQPDKALLLLCKKSVEDSFEAKKWEDIAEAMVKRGQKGMERYSSEVVKLQFKKLMLSADALDFARTGRMQGVGEEEEEEEGDVGGASGSEGGKGAGIEEDGGEEEMADDEEDMEEEEEASMV